MSVHPQSDPYKHTKDSGSTKPSQRRSRISKRDTDRSKRETGHYLTYYQSSLADGRSDSSDHEPANSTHHIKHLSVNSTSSSEYSEAEAVNPKPMDSLTPVFPSQAKMRSAIPSDGGSDRRRMAIIEVDRLPELASEEKPRQDTGSIRTRRGLPHSLAGLALVAPPDAAPKSYTHLTPPSTAPLSASNAVIEDEKGHHRSSSEAVGANTRSTRDHSRDSTEPTTGTPSQPHIVLNDGFAQLTVLKHPVPRRRPPSLYSTSDDSDQYSSRHPRSRPLITTPNIGQEKAIDVRVAPPVIISLESAAPIRRRKASTRTPSSAPQSSVPPATAPLAPPSNSLYQLEVLPPPPPPRAMFTVDSKSPAPPRPPRLHSPAAPRTKDDIEAVKRALQLPPSVAAALAAKTADATSKNHPKPLKVEERVSDSSSNGISSGGADLHHVKSIHRREGAYPVSHSTTSESDKANSPTVSTVNSTDSEAAKDVPKAPDETLSNNRVENDSEVDNDVPDMSFVRLVRNTKQQYQERDGSVSDAPVSASYKRRTFDGATSELDTPTRSSHHKEPGVDAPSPPPKTTRDSWSTPKRFSALPRTPSLSSRSPQRSSSGTQYSGTLYSSRTPSPSPRQAQLPRPRIKSMNPPAMFCAEIFSYKSTLERCRLYAEKINELYMYDSGLGDWTIETRNRANSNRPTIALSPHTITPQPRHTSGSSIISEATFPLRSDASVATDLSVKLDDLMPAAPPNLPYPSLADRHLFPPRSTSSIATSPSIRSHASSTQSTKSGGFFSSLGRKASLSSAKKDKAAPLMPSNSSPASSTKLLKGPPPPRVVNISHAPSVPGGPRAPPGHRLLRSQTLLPPAMKTPSPERSDALGRHPSLADLTQSPVLDKSSDPDFARQVDKLADLLPHADRSVLAGYLRRAGQDVLAIGQYLEDEKNGTIQV